jgi:hypothetical protein
LPTQQSSDIYLEIKVNGITDIIPKMFLKIRKRLVLKLENKSAMILAKNQTYSRKTKLIGIK